MQDWVQYRETLQTRVGEFAELNQDVMQALQAVQGAAPETGHLQPKVHSLIALAVAVTTRCHGCIVTPAQKAAENGATREKIAEALGTAIALDAGAALVYTGQVFDAVDVIAS